MRAMILLFISLTAFASENVGWNKVPLTPDHPFRGLYQDKNVDALFIADDSSSNLMPAAQHMVVPAAQDFSHQSKTLAANVFGKLEVNLKSASTIQMVHESFHAGAHHDLRAIVYETKSADKDASYISCVAVIQKQASVHVIFMKSYAEVFKSENQDKNICSSRLQQLAQSTVLYQ